MKNTKHHVSDQEIQRRLQFCRERRWMFLCRSAKCFREAFEFLYLGLRFYMSCAQMILQLILRCGYRRLAPGLRRERNVLSCDDGLFLPNAETEPCGCLARKVPSRSEEKALSVTSNRIGSSASLGSFFVFVLMVLYVINNRTGDRNSCIKNRIRNLPDSTFGF